jgi:nucleotide-binding universal stress UspA family protein
MATRRFKKSCFGGVTATMVRDAKIPVLLAH